MRKLFLIVILELAFGTFAHAKPWRGIVSLHSTRADVERLFGKPNGKYGRYEFEDEWAKISYSTGRCVNGWNVPEGTVIDITVNSTRPLRISDLKIDLAQYDKFRDPHVTSHVYYTHKTDGIRYVAIEPEGETNGEVLTTYYESTTEDERRFYCHKSGNGWRGIIPLHSTRALVEAVLGKSDDACRCKFKTPNESVVIDYSKGPCKGPPYGWNVHAGTVVQITVYPKSELSLRQLNLDFTEYVRSQDPSESTLHYINAEAGVKYSVQDNRIHSITYIRMRCKCRGSRLPARRWLFSSKVQSPSTGFGQTSL